jgi:hypothetical protein
MASTGTQPGHEDDAGAKQGEGEMNYVKFPSHRARKYSLALLRHRVPDEVLPEAYYIAFDSPRRYLVHHGIYGITEKQLNVLVGLKGIDRNVKLTVLTPPYNDLMRCMNG